MKFESKNIDPAYNNHRFHLFNIIIEFLFIRIYFSYYSENIHSIFKHLAIDPFGTIPRLSVSLSLSAVAFRGSLRYNHMIYYVFDLRILYCSFIVGPKGSGKYFLREPCINHTRNLVRNNSASFSLLRIFTSASSGQCALLCSSGFQISISPLPSFTDKSLLSALSVC